MPRDRARRPMGIGWVVTWPLLPIFALLVFLTAEEIHRPRAEVVPIEGGPNWEERLQQRIDSVTMALSSSSLEVADPVETKTGSGTVRYLHRGYSVTFRPERQIETELAIEALRDVDPGVTLTRDALEPDGFEVKVGIDGLLTHTLTFRPLQPPSGPPRVALVARSLGDDLRVAREIVGIDAPIAIGVRPARPFSREVAELARLFGREVVLDISLSVEAGDSDTEPGVMPLDGRLQANLDRAMQTVPYAVGVTADVPQSLAATPTRLEGFLGELNRRNLFWVGDLPDLHRLQGLRTAAGVRVAMSSVPVTDEQRETLAKRLDEAGRGARADGVPVMLETTSSEALAVVAEMVRKWRAGGVDVVPVSSIPRALVVAPAR